MNGEVVFSIDIKIKKGLFKLPVYSSDLFADVSNRLFQVSTTTEDKKASVSAKLRDQLSLLLEQGKISEKTKSKLRNLLHDNSPSRGDGDEEVNRSSEGHFRILQESIYHAKISANWHHRRHYKYL
jgi:hypothetical protein